MHIPVNMLLRASDKCLPPDAAKTIFAALRNANPDAVTKARRHLADPVDIVRNARLTDDQTLRLVYDRYGEASLFKLLVLTGGQRAQYFEWMLTCITQQLIFLGSDKLQDNVMVPNNDRLPEGPEAARYNTNVLRPWLSHELYLSGVRHGFLVLGIGGGRVLVSHPFFNHRNETYGLLHYAVPIDVQLVKQAAGQIGA